jgi:Tfp pilus assembly protein PilN
MDDPKKITPEDLRKTPLLRGTIELFDINILPERYRRRKITLISVLPWLILVLLIGALYPAATNAIKAQNDFQEIQAELLLTKTELEIMQTNTESLENIQNEIASETDRRDQVLSSYGGINLRGTSWNATLLRIYQITPPDIVWNAVSQQENEILLDGMATSYQVVLDFYDSLDHLTGLQSVEITSMEQVIDEDAVVATTSKEEEGNSNATDPSAPYSFTILSTTDGEVLP